MLGSLWRKAPYCWWEFKLLQPAWRTVRRFLKTKNRATIWPSNPTPRHISRKDENLKRYMHPNVHNRTIYSSQDMETTHVPIIRWFVYEMQRCEWNYPKRESQERSFQENFRDWNMDGNSSYSHQPDRRDVVKYRVLDTILRKIAP